METCIQNGTPETGCHAPHSSRSSTMQTRRTHGIGTLPRVLLALSLTAASAGCSAGTDEGPISELDEVAAENVLYGTSRTLTRNGIQEGLLEADSIHMWRDSTHSRVYGLTLFLYDERGREKGRVTADGGRLSTLRAELWAFGSALLSVPADELNEAREIEADELHFELDRDRIWTRVPVRMMRGGCEVTGDGFDTDLSFNDLRIESPREGGCSES